MINPFANKYSVGSSSPTDHLLGTELTLFSSNAEVEKTNDKGLKTLLDSYAEMARGAVKIVWVKRSQIPPSNLEVTSKEKVYYTAISSFLGRKEKELKSEFAKMKLIESRLLSQFASSTHLAVDGKEVKASKQIQGNYTIKTEKAKADFEKKMRNPDTSLQERIQLGHHFLKGLTNLHLVDFTHGDMKPENCLIYEKEGTQFLKISDFGKASEVKDHEAVSYSGNTRFAPPEGKQSKQGDVYSAALILIRNFEEEYLKNSQNLSLVNIDKEHFDIPAAPEFRGIEKYVVEHKAFQACNEGLNLDILKRRLLMSNLSSQEKTMQSQAIHHYIDALHTQLKEDERLSSHQVDTLCHLLKHMTEADPKNRISAAEATEIYQNIFMENFLF